MEKELHGYQVLTTNHPAPSTKIEYRLHMSIFFIAVQNRTENREKKREKIERFNCKDPKLCFDSVLFLCTGFILETLNNFCCGEFKSVFKPNNYRCFRWYNFANTQTVDKTINNTDRNTNGTL